ncbi:MAG: hypothetical protein GY722_10825 [bacterium]|nr:hypothetical protein [bacterium]
MAELGCQRRGLRTALACIATALVALPYSGVAAGLASETFTNADGTVLTTTVDPDARLVRYDFDFSTLPYSYEQISLALPDGTAVVFWAPYIHRDNPISPFSTGFIINDDSGLQMEYQTAATPPAVSWIEFHFRQEFTFVGLVLPDVESENVQVTFREPTGGFPPDQEDNVKLRAFAPVFASSPPGQVAGVLMDKSMGPVQLTLFWGTSCSTSAADYAVYEGTLESLRVGLYDHSSVRCSDVTPLLQETLVPTAGETYYLVVPLGADAEGSYGTRLDGTTPSERPTGVSQCLAAQELGCP